MRALRFAAVLLVAALAACENGKGFVVVTLDSATPLTITAVDVTVSNNGKTGRATLGRSFSLPPPQDFVIELPDDRRGFVQLELVARNGTTEIARGNGSVTVGGAGKIELTITLTASEGPLPDLATTVDLTSAAADLAAPTIDLATPSNDDLTPATTLDLASATTDLRIAPAPDLTVATPADLAAPPVEDLPVEDLTIPEDLLAPDLAEPDLLVRDLLPAADLKQPILAFTPGASLTVTDPKWVAVADVDSLLGLDLVYVDASGVHYQLGVGDGTFASLVLDVPGMTGADFLRVAVGELNADGANDVVATRGATDPKVYVSKTTLGVLGAAATIPAGAAPSGLVLGDTDGAGLDLFVTSTPTETDGLALLVGGNDGTFAAAAPFSTCVDPADVASGELNGDARSDVAVACTGTSVDATRKPAIEVRLTDASGLSTTTRTLSDATDRGFAGVAIANVVGTLALDVIGACPDCSQVQIFANDGNGTFGSAQPFAVGDLNLPSAIAVGDVDGDGDLDIVVGGTKQAAGTGGIAVLLGDGAGSFAAVTAAQRFATDLTVLQVVIVDLDGDNLAEIVMVTTSGIAILHNTTS